MKIKKITDPVYGSCNKCCFQDDIDTTNCKDCDTETYYIESTGSYYDNELQQIIDEKSDYPASIKVYGTTCQTKNMALNLDSIESIRAFLDIIEEDLLKKDLKNY